MRVKTLRILIYGISAALTLVAGSVIVFTFLQQPVVDVKLQITQTDNGPMSLDPDSLTPSLQDLHRVARMPLRQTLFDPPPPTPVHIVEKVVPPPRVKLIGTLINPRQPSALIADERGHVEIKKIGESVGPDNNPAILKGISKDHVMLEHRGNPIRLNLEEGQP